MGRRHRFQERASRYGQRHVFKARDLTEAQHGHLVTVQHHELVKCRGYLLRVREATADDLTARPGQLVIHMRARRETRAVGPDWKVGVYPDSSVIVHSQTVYDDATGGDAA